ncbi:FAD-binding oxidoreductase, partial [Streptomyces sp. NPDC058953]|uniref:FAD-binding oxidoreductase n=1 Tax=Streptomyces sp. NPDC058953 TaxID=3346676 RepID=UPI00369D7651
LFLTHPPPRPGARARPPAPVTHHATVAEIVRHSPGTIEFTLDVDDRDALDFLPGQYVNVDVPGAGVTRSYSFSSGPARRQVSFLVRTVPGGAMSGYLTEHARAGDRLTFTGPLGSFYLRELTRPALLLAGGTGLAPLLAMLDTMTGAPPAPPVRLIYGVTTDRDLVHLDTLEHYAQALPSFTFDHCVADAASTARNKGYVTGLMDAGTLHGGDTDVYLCGPPPMVEAVRTHIAALGVTPAGFHYEKFTPAAAVRETVGAA